jgi:DNA repair exonuclease SbcCD ATPase subunit
MADPPRALKRAKKGETEEAEAEIFSRPEVLVYQNKALASFLGTERANKAKLTKQIASLELKCSNLLSCTSLISHQMFVINDKLISAGTSNGHNIDPSLNLKSESSNFAKFQNVGDNLEMFSKSDFDSKSQIEDAGTNIAAMLDLVLANNSDGNESKPMEVDYNTEYHNIQNEAVLYKTQIEELKHQISEMTGEHKQNMIKMKMLQLRGDRYFPYVRFESQMFDVDIPKHECTCHTCGDTMAKAIEEAKVELNATQHGKPETDKVDFKSLNDAEVSLAAINKINKALFEVIQDMKRQEYSDNQEIIKSRAFQRLFQSGSQMLSTHQKLVSANEDLTKQTTELEIKHEQEIRALQGNYKVKHDEYLGLLHNLETQLKFSEIEKENLQREVHKLKPSETDEQATTEPDLNARLSTLEAENKKAKDDLSRTIKEKSIITDRLNPLRIELDTALETIKSLKNDPKGDAPDLAASIESQSKQIKDLVEECKGLKDQLDQTYSEMESIYEANQDLENKNKLLTTRSDDSNKLYNKAVEESFKKTRVSENCK